MGHLLKRKNRVRRNRGSKVRAGALAGKTFLRSDGTKITVHRRVGIRNRTVYKATENGRLINVTAKALRKLIPA